MGPDERALLTVAVVCAVVVICVYYSSHRAPVIEDPGEAVQDRGAPRSTSGLRRRQRGGVPSNSTNAQPLRLAHTGVGDQTRHCCSSAMQSQHMRSPPGAAGTSIVYCQISPAKDSKDQQDRVCLGLHPSVANYVQANYEHYRGGDPGALGLFLQRTFTRARSGHVVIAISCHGNKDGHFKDVSTTGNFLWDPTKLWNGYETFDGLEHTLEASTATKVDIVVSQCHGAVFADELRRLIPDSYHNVHVHGLSYRRTQRIFSRFTNWTLSSNVYHKQLAQWFARHCANTPPH